MTIDEAVQETIKTNPQVEIKKAELETEKELLTATKSDYLPKVDLSYSVGPETTQTIGNSRDRVDETRQDASATLTQNVFAGFDTMYAVDQQKALVLSAANGVQESANSIALETVTAYVDILRNKELLDISKQNVDVHKKYLDQIKEKVDAGVGRSSDYKQTLSRYENAQSIYFLNEQNYKNSLYSFQRILPGDISIESLVKPTVGALPVQSLEELTALALENNPTIHLSHANVQSAEAALSRSNASYYPRADLKAQSYWNKNLNGFSKDANGPSSPPKAFVEENGYNVLLVISFNLFNGLADSANKEANRHRLLKQHSALSDSKRYVEAYAKIAWQTFESTGQQLVHIEKNIQASAETVANYQEENDLGRRSIIDLLNIELEYNAAQNRKVTAEYDRLLSYYQILTHSGKILEAMNVTVK
jgi:adhesin transport system outer membrane protein